ncbi:MAG TPA: PKD domain-containing protein [Bacillota bacterium]|nr:PKD domain-containing protein [Bacillota bacterium]
MKRNFLIGILLVIGLIFLTVGAGYGFSQATPQYFYYTKDLKLAVEDFGEEKTVTIPEGPLSFPADVKWNISVDKKSAISTPVKPFAKIYLVDAKGSKKEQVALKPGDSKAGILKLQPGQLCQIVLNAGEHKGLFNKYGAKVDLACNYQVIRVMVTEMDTPGHFQLNAAGPSGSRWIWTLPDSQQIAGAEADVIFPSGLMPVTLSDQEQRNTFTFQLPVPEATEFNPQISSTTGYEEFSLKGQANVIDHYQSVSKITWDFGDGSPVVSQDVFEHTYRQAGNYYLKLSLRNSYNQEFEKVWVVNVQPFQIVNSDVIVSPVKGSSPLKVSYSAKPKVLGQPSKLKYFWDFGDGTSASVNAGEHVYTRKGEYRITYTLMDENHSSLNLPPWTTLVSVAPPALKLSVRNEPESGVIPLQVRFNSDLKIEGGPTDIEYIWDFGDETISNTPDPTHTFAEPGRYWVNLTVTDRLNDTTVRKKIAIAAFPPVITSNSRLEPLSGVAPLMINGEGDAKVTGYPSKLSYTWFINDRPVGNDRNLQYRFSTPGSYTVVLVISDTLPWHNGKATHTWNVIVAGAQEEGPLPSAIPKTTKTVLPSRIASNTPTPTLNWFDGSSKN